MLRVDTLNVVEGIANDGIQSSENAERHHRKKQSTQKSSFLN